MLRLNRAMLAAFLCAGGPVATGMCGMDQMSPFNEAQWTTLQDTRTTTSRAMVAPNSLAGDGTRMGDTPVVLTDRLAEENQPVEISGPTCGLPSTSTAPDREPESGLR